MSTHNCKKGKVFGICPLLQRYLVLPDLLYSFFRYPMEEGERFTLVLASTLDESGQPSDGTYNSSGEPSLADKYE